MQAKEQLEGERAQLRAELERVQNKLEVSQHKQAELQAQLHDVVSSYH